MDTIKSSAEISRLFSSGKRYKTPHVTLIVEEVGQGNSSGTCKQHGQPGRVAFIAGKKLGNAVWRNSAKRRMREICHNLGGPWPGFDVIFLAKGSICKVPYQQVFGPCEKAVHRVTARKKGSSVEHADQDH